jgi:hypothetical protein
MSITLGRDLRETLKAMFHPLPARSKLGGERCAARVSVLVRMANEQMVISLHRSYFPFLSRMRIRSIYI